MILEAFAGAGGISEALRMVLPDVPTLGIEKDADACATAEAAGHKRLQADVSMLDLRPYVGLVEGFCAGPPCQSFSSAGRQRGKLDKPRIVAHVERIRKAGRWLHYSREGWHDPRSPLVLEVLRYALTLRPEWIVLEQVPSVLPLWELVGDVLRDQGWHVEAGVLQAEQYGVPQTRKRAILAARRCLPGCPREPSVCVRSQGLLPAPTHRLYRKGVPREAGDQSLLPWVSMADALGWGWTAAPCWTVMTARNRQTGCDVLRGSSWRADRIRQLVQSDEWLPKCSLRQSAMANATVRTLEQPAPTVTAAHDRAERRWVSPGPEPKSIRVNVEEAGVLQSFRADYPWQGSMSAQYRQVGDAAPPVLMAPVIAALTKR